MSTEIISNILNPDKYSIRLTQTSKGVWYCVRLEVNEPIPYEMLLKIEALAVETNLMLKRINING